MNLIKRILNLTYYTSDIDAFLAKFDSTHPHLSDSQRQEKEKYARIYQLRDKADLSTPKVSCWEDF